MLSAQNTTLPHLGADIRPAQPERDYGPEPLTARIAMEAVNLLAVMKPTCDASGNWLSRPAQEIDGDDRRVLRAMATENV